MKLRAPSARIDRAHGAAETALTTIEVRVRARKISKGPGGRDAPFVWGQYLDDRHRDAQWGLLGTSAAVQILGMRTITPATEPTVKGGALVLPRSTTAPHPLHRAKDPQRDFENIVRLASVAEALDIGAAQVPSGTRPQIVRKVFDVLQGQPYWDTESAKPGHQPSGGDVFATAFVMHALRRYERVGELRDVRVWLADQLRADRVKKRLDHVALIGLSLTPIEKDPHEGDAVRRAREECVKLVCAWARRGPLVVDRPFFNGYTTGAKNDYTFISPEVVGALFLVRRRAPGRSPRVVVDIVERVVAATPDGSAFNGQPSMLATVDQLWAARLLKEFSQTFDKDDPHGMRRMAMLPQRRVVVGAISLVVVAGIIALLLLGQVGEAIGLVITWLLGLLAALWKWLR